MEGFDVGQIDTLKAFQIFKLAGQTAEPVFTNLSGDHKLPPPGTDAALLGSQFLAELLHGEAGVLRQRLGVTQLSLTSFLTEHIFPGYGINLPMSVHFPLHQRSNITRAHGWCLPFWVPKFLAEPLPGKAEVVRQQLGVLQITLTSFLTEHIFPG